VKGDGRDDLVDLLVDGVDGPALLATGVVDPGGDGWVELHRREPAASLRGQDPAGCPTVVGVGDVDLAQYHLCPWSLGAPDHPEAELAVDAGGERQGRHAGRS